MLPISVCRFARRRSCPGVSPQRFDSPWHARLFIGESWHTSPGDHIPARRLFSCQGASPLACLDWGGCFGGVFFKKVSISPLVRTGETVLVMLFLKDLYFFDPLTCSHWEGHFGGVFCEKISPFTCSHWEPSFGRVFCENIYPSTCSH